MKKGNFKKGIIGLACLSSCQFFSTAFAVDEEDSLAFRPKPTIYGPRVTAGMFYQNHRSSFGELDFFMPLFQTRRTLFFGDVRGLDYFGPALEGNFGGGFRHLVSPDWFYGLYGFFDARRTADKNTFHQVTA